MGGLSWGAPSLGLSLAALGAAVSAGNAYANAESSSQSGVIAQSGPPAVLRPYSDEIERDFSVRSVGQLQITNIRGDVELQGWALDKIRVKAQRTAGAESLDGAKRLLSGVDVRFRESGKNVDLSAEYGRGLDISERLHERRDPHTSMKMVVFAPMNMSVRVWAEAGKVSVKNWNAPVDVRTSTGAIDVSAVKADGVSTLCPGCAIRIAGVRGSVRCMGGDGDASLADVTGPQIYVESSGGNVIAERVSGEQLYVSGSGKITGKQLSGSIEFRTRQASVDFADLRGFLSGRTESGDIRATMRAWKFVDKALIESASGNIDLRLPMSFSGEVDLWSVKGKVDVGFPLQISESNQAVGPQPASHILGRISDGGDLLKVFSDRGDIRVARVFQ